MQVHSRRQPHLNSAHQHENTMAFALSAMQGLRRSSRANSSMSFVIVTYYRWICPKCVQDEFNFTREYYSKHTAHEWMDRYWDEPSNDYDDEDIPYKSKVTQDHQHHLMVMHSPIMGIKDSCFIVCSCSASAMPMSHRRPDQDARGASDGTCQRTSGLGNLEKSVLQYQSLRRWARTSSFFGINITNHKQDPCYPPYVGDIYADCCNRPYPKLAYSGPIWQAPASVEHSRWVTGAEVAD